MMVSEPLEKNQLSDIENQAGRVGLEEPELSGDSGEIPAQSSWYYHDYSDEPRLRDLPLRLLNLPRLIILALIRFYQLTFSRGLPANTCRFYPSCSHYGYQAIYKHGAIKGSLMAAWRILRCNPFNRGGYDPVP